jgi:hypothetical protein
MSPATNGGKQKPNFGSTADVTVDVNHEHADRTVKKETEHAKIFIIAT